MQIPRSYYFAILIFGKTRLLLLLLSKIVTVTVTNINVGDSNCRTLCGRLSGRGRKAFGAHAGCRTPVALVHKYLYRKSYFLRHFNTCTLWPFSHVFIAFHGKSRPILALLPETSQNHITKNRNRQNRFVGHIKV
jgi:hypothetical protein